MTLTSGGAVVAVVEVVDVGIGVDEVKGQT